MAYKYTQPLGEKTACAVGKHLPISRKQATEVCKFLRGKKVSTAKNILGRVIEMKQAIPFTRFTGDTGHRKGMASGRYPQKTSKEILKVIQSAEANAQFKGLATENLVLKQICSQKDSNQSRQGRHYGRVMKRTHIEVVVEEKIIKTTPTNKKKQK